MPITRVGHSRNGGIGSTFRLSIPTGTEGNDLMVASVIVGTGNPAVTGVPAGWTLRGQRRTDHASVYVYSKKSEGETGSLTWVLSAGTVTTGAIVSYRGAGLVDNLTSADGSRFNGTFSYDVPGLAPRKTTDREIVFAAVGSSDVVTAVPTIKVPVLTFQTAFAEITSLLGLTNALMGSVWDRTVGVLQNTQTASLTQSVSGAGRGVTVRLLLTENRPPNAPLVSMPASIDRTRAFDVFVTAQDPDPNDSTSQTYIRFRRSITPTPPWTTFFRTSPTTIVRIQADTLDFGQYELQAATRDAFGEPAADQNLKYSASVFFLAANPPNGPTFLTPTAGSFIGASSAVFTVQVANLDSLDYRVVNDQNTIIVPQASVTSGDLRRFVVADLPNATRVHVQARAVLNGIPSDWSTSSHLVAYTPPAEIRGSVLPSARGLVITSTNPAPEVGQPNISYLEVKRGIVSPDGSIFEQGFLRSPSGTSRRLRLTAGTSYEDGTVAWGWDYAYMFHAIGANGTRSEGPWVKSFVDLHTFEPLPVIVDPRDEPIDEGDFADLDFDPTDFG